MGECLVVVRPFQQPGSFGDETKTCTTVTGCSFRRVQWIFYMQSLTDKASHTPPLIYQSWTLVGTENGAARTHDPVHSGPTTITTAPRPAPLLRSILRWLCNILKLYYKNE